MLARLRALAIGLLWLALPCGVCAQYDPAFNHYWALQSFYNPAASGLDGRLNVQGAYAMQMMGYEHAPATMVLTADLPLWLIGPDHGVGAGFINDRIGLFEHKKFFAHYAYHQRLWGGRFSVGVRAGMLAESFDGTRLDLIDSGDPAFPTSEANGTAFDLDAGFRFDAKTWYAGFSVLHTMSPLVTIGETKANEYEVPHAFYLTGGYNIRLRQPLFNIQTDAIVGEIDLSNVVHHHDTHQNQCRCCSLFRNSKEQWREEQCHCKADGCNKAGHPRASTCIHT